MKLEWHHLRNLGKSDRAGRWYPNKDVSEYFGHIRPPSRAWPWSYAKAALTQKFLKWLKEHHQELVPAEFKEVKHDAP